MKLGNVFILGDSYSTFEGYIPEGYYTWYTVGGIPQTDVVSVDQTWWHRLLSRTESNLILNCSYSGTTVCHTGYGGGDISWASFAGRLDRLIEDGFFKENKIDTFFLFGGTNDSWADSPIGEMKTDNFTKEDVYFVLPAFAYILSRAQENIPGVRIVAIINDELKDEITNGYVEACRHFGVEAVLLHDIEKLNGHPAIRGMEQIEEQVYDAMGLTSEN